MIKRHPSFEYIPDDTILWQYMSLTKFLFLIKNKKLHLHRIDDFPDKDEGVLSVLDKKSLTIYKETDEWERYLEDDRKQTFISCWIKYPTEQSLMWYAYGKDGVAIRTSARAIRLAMDGDKENKLYMIDVKYIDKKRRSVHLPGERINFYHFYTTKRKFFDMESEVRLVYHDDDKLHTEDLGFNVDIELNELIEDIKVSSSLPEYVYDLICQEVKESGIEVIPSMSEI